MDLTKIKDLDAAIIDTKLLVASPFMDEAIFNRAVILICEHNKEDGSLGYILNKKVDLKLNDLIADFPAFDSEIYYGGPVGTETIHYMHNVGDLLPNSVKIAEGVFWGGDFEVLKQLINTELIKPYNIRFFLGYAGWGAGQLQGEMREHAWMLCHLDANYVFKKHKKDVWKLVLQQEGGTFGVIATISEELSWN